MKGNLARWLFIRHPDLKKELWGGHLWNPSYCAVDLGLNSDAVCSIMEADGTVSARKFIDFADEKDRLWKTLNRIRQPDPERGKRTQTEKNVQDADRRMHRKNENLNLNLS